MDPLGDLMVFNSPPNKSVLALSEQPAKQSISPGSNPFDTLLKVASGCTYTQTVNETNLLDVAFVEGATFVFTQTFSSDTRDSLGLPNLNGDDCGRESLGILHINFNELNDKSGDDVFLKDALTVQTPHKSSYHSFLKSISCRSSQSSQPSTIYSIQPSFHSSLSESNLFNLALSPTLIEKHLRSANSIIVSPRRANSVSCFDPKHLEGFRRRISSGPCMLNKDKADLENILGDGLLPRQNIFSDCSTKNPEENKDGSMEDLVFAEISHTAAKIADGSILEATTDSNMLDDTPAPDFEEILANIPEEKKKCDTETVFKIIDKMLPTNSENSNVKSTSKNSSSGSDNLKTNCSHHSAKEAIQSLAEILNSENLNEERKTAGQHLLKSLAGILCNENNSEDMSSLNDSGHSSIEVEQYVQEKGECYQVLDLCKKSSTSSEIEQTEALDLSVGAKKVNVTPKSSTFSRRGSISLKEMNKTPVDHSGMVRRASESSLHSSRNQSVQSNQTGSSNASGASLLSGPITGKIKLKKISVTKTGPVKAVLGLASKISTPGTPRTASEASKLKKTSTPVNKSKIKPIAQSTPEENRTSVIPQKKFYYPMSPLSRPVSSQPKTASDPNLVSGCSDQQLTRSNSATNIKNKTTSTLLSMRRSCSSGKGIGLKKPTETDKLKSNIRKGLDGNVLNRSLSSRPFSLLSKFKKGPGKENVGHK